MTDNVFTGINSDPTYVVKGGASIATKSLTDVFGNKRIIAEHLVSIVDVLVQLFIINFIIELENAKCKCVDTWSAKALKILSVMVIAANVMDRTIGIGNLGKQIFTWIAMTHMATLIYFVWELRCKNGCVMDHKYRAIQLYAYVSLFFFISSVGLYGALLKKARSKVGVKTIS